MKTPKVRFFLIKDKTSSSPESEYTRLYKVQGNANPVFFCFPYSKGTLNRNWQISFNFTASRNLTLKSSKKRGQEIFAIKPIELTLEEAFLIMLNK